MTRFGIFLLTGILLSTMAMSQTTLPLAPPHVTAPRDARSTEPAHRACWWCHTTTTTSGQQARVVSQVKLHAKVSWPTCLSCHDGLTASALDDGHANHAPTKFHSGLDCLACHDPHDRSGSYRMLRGNHGPETAQTAVLNFCRECHSDH